MRLLVDSVPSGSPGIVAVRDELASALGTQAPDGCDAVLLTSSEMASLETAGRLRVVPCPKLSGGWSGRWQWHSRRLPVLAAEQGADVVYSMAGILSTPLCRRFGTVTTVNNMLPFQPLSETGYRTWSMMAVRLLTLRRVYVRSLRIADAVILHSQHALNMIGKYAPGVSSKTLVALTGVPKSLGFSPAAPPPHPYAGRPYVLYFSVFYAYKNHLRVIEAYERCIASQPELPDLLFVGRPDEPGYVREVLEGIAARGLSERIRYLGPVARAEIAAWLHHAELNLFASTCETNPVTVAEILGTGGVLACSGTAPMPEVAGRAAEYFDPLSAASIAEVMLGLMRHPERRAELRRLALERGRELSWEACADRVWEAARAAHAAHAGAGS